MADREKKGLVARWLEGKERSEDYARSTLPTNRWSLFWDIFKGRFGKLVLVNLIMVVTILPLAALIVWRMLALGVEGTVGPYGAGLGVGYPILPELVGYAEMSMFQADLLFFALFIPAGAIAALGISGGGYIIRNLIWTEGIFVTNDFLRGIRRNYWNVFEAEPLRLARRARCERRGLAHRLQGDGVHLCGARRPHLLLDDLVGHQL